MVDKIEGWVKTGHFNFDVAIINSQNLDLPMATSKFLHRKEEHMRQYLQNADIMQFEIRNITEEIREFCFRLVFRCITIALKSIDAKLVEYYYVIPDKKINITVDMIIVDPDNYSGPVSPVEAAFDTPNSTNGYIPLQYNIHYLIKYFILFKFGRKKIIERYMVAVLIHELTHFIDMGQIIFSDRRQERVKRWHNSTLSKLGIHAGIYLNAVYLLDVIDSLRIEGLATANMRSGRIVLHFKFRDIFTFRKLVTKITKSTDTTELDELYKEARFLTYDLGNLMFFTIELALLKRNGSKDIEITLDDNRPITAELDNIGKVLNKLTHSKGWVKLKPQSYITIRKNLNYYTHLDARKFLKLYEKSCKELGINRAHMVVWWDLFDYWKKEATEYYQKREAIKRARFVSK